MRQAGVAGARDTVKCDRVKDARRRFTMEAGSDWKNALGSHAIHHRCRQSCQLGAPGNLIVTASAAVGL